MTSRTVVVGAGLSGLLAAYRRALSGDQVTVLEAADHLGGAVQGTEVAGVAISGGAEAYAIGSGAVDALVEELGLTGRTVTPRGGLSSRIVSRAGVHRALSGSIFGVPSRPMAADARAILGRRGSLRAAAERLIPASHGLQPGVSIGSLVASRCGRRVADRLVAPVIGGVHSADPWTLDAESVAPQLVAGLREGRSLTRTITGLIGRQAGSRSAGANVRSLAPTMSALPEALVARLEGAGAEIRTATPVEAIGRTGEVWTITAGEETWEADHLVLACAPAVAATLLEHCAPEVAAAVPRPAAIPVRLVALVVDSPALDALPTGTGALVAPGTPGVRAKALTHVSAKWEHVAEAARAAHPEATAPHVLRLSYGRPGEQLPGESSLADVGLADASAILGVPLSRRDLLGHAVFDWPETMHRMGPGHRAALARLDTALAEVPGLELIGSWRSGTGLDAVVRSHLNSTPTRKDTEHDLS